MPEGWQIRPADDDAPASPDPLAAVPTDFPTSSAQHASTPPSSPTAQGTTPPSDPPPEEPSTHPSPVEPGATDSVLLRRIAELESALALAGSSEVIELNDQRVLQDVGIYRYHHPLEDAAAYKDRLSEINSRVDSLVKANQAVLADILSASHGSLAKGRKMVADLLKLMLRAYNAEA